MNLFDLSASVSADFSKADRGLSENQKKVIALEKEYQKLDKATAQVGQSGNKLGTALGNLGSSAIAARNPLSGVTAELENVGLFAEGAGGPLAALAVIIGTNVTAAIGLNKALLDLATSTSEFQGAFTDLSQQTGVAVETLSAFELLSRQTGGSLDGIVASLGIFQKNLEAAQGGTSKQAEALNELGVQTLVTEDALRQTMAALAKMPEGFHQTALALELFGRGGKQMLAILKETHGDLDAAQAKFRAMGLEISGPTAAAADKLNDEMVILDAQTRALHNSLGVMVMPTVISTVELLTKAIQDNRQSVELAAGAVGVLASYLGSSLVAGIYAATAALAVMQAQLAPIVAAVQFIKGLSGLSGDIPMGRTHDAATDTAGLGSMLGAGIFRAKGVGGGSKGGGGGGAKSDPVVEYIKRLDAELAKLSDGYSGIDTATKLYAVTQDIATGALKKASLATQDHAKVLATDFDRVTKQTKAKAELKTFTDEQNEAVRQAIDGDKSYFAAVSDLVAAQMKLGEVLDDTTVFWFNHQAAILANKAALDMYKATLEPIMLGGSASDGIGDDVIAKAAGAAGDAAAGTTPRNYHADLLAFRERMHDLAADLTDTIADSLHRGFERGMKAGLISFADGILQMVESAALRSLEAKLFGVLSGSGGSGGGWLSKIIGIVGGVAGGATGGGAATWGNIGAKIGFPHAMGLDYVPYDNYPARLHKGERVMTAAENANGGSVTHVHHWNIVTQDARSFMSGPTQHQIGQRLNQLTGKAALVG